VVVGCCFGFPRYVILLPFIDPSSAVAEATISGNSSSSRMSVYNGPIRFTPVLEMQFLYSRYLGRDSVGAYLTSKLVRLIAN